MHHDLYLDDSIGLVLFHAQGLLKEQLQLAKVRLADGRTRYSIKAIEETLSFDKVCLES